MESCATQKKFADFTCQVWKDGWAARMPAAGGTSHYFTAPSAASTPRRGLHHAVPVFGGARAAGLPPALLCRPSKHTIINFYKNATRHLAAAPQCSAHSPIDRGAISLNLKFDVSFETMSLSLEERRAGAPRAGLALGRAGHGGGGAGTAGTARHGSEQGATTQQPTFGSGAHTHARTPHRQSSTTPTHATQTQT